MPQRYLMTIEVFVKFIAKPFFNNFKPLKTLHNRQFPFWDMGNNHLFKIMRATAGKLLSKFFFVMHINHRKLRLVRTPLIAAKTVE